MQELDHCYGLHSEPALAVWSWHGAAFENRRRAIRVSRGVRRTLAVLVLALVLLLTAGCGGDDSGGGGGGGTNTTQTDDSGY